MTTPPRLVRDIEALCSEGLNAAIELEGSRLYVVVRSLDTPRYTPAVADELMVMTDFQYNQSKMDMFWTIPFLRRADGMPPSQADVMETYLGKQWQRWSYHYGQWDPACHDVRTHLEVVFERLARGD